MTAYKVNNAETETCTALKSYKNNTTTTTTILQPFVRDYAGEVAPEETLTHPPS